jgi:hypothetical protein
MNYCNNMTKGALRQVSISKVIRIVVASSLAVATEHK